VRIATSTSVFWKNPAVYRVNNQQVGPWSDVATGGVMG
jgi:hypothetical protein